MDIAHDSLKSPFLREIARRGLLYQSTDLGELDAALSGPPISAYIGFDCTAPSLHAGSLVPITLLRALQRHGHQAIVVLGGGTSRIGDPSDKDEMRPVLSDEAIRENMAGIRSVLERFLVPGEGQAEAVFVDNAEWLDSLGYLDFLRDIGRHFTINRMLAMEGVSRRLEREQPMSFLEFNYMVLQAYDFVELARRYDCLLQMGGSDQWGNIVTGVDLVRRLLGRGAHAITAPLLETASGAKMGKSADGAVWLDGERMSPYDFWQFWRNVDDADVGAYLRWFSDVPEDEQERLLALRGAELNEAKKVLATEMTALAHGAAAAAGAAETARETFEAGGLGADLPELTVAREEIAAGVPLLELLRRTGLCASGGEARRLVAGRGARLNDDVVEDAGRTVTPADASSDGVIKLAAGKKRIALVRMR